MACLMLIAAKAVVKVKAMSISSRRFSSSGPCFWLSALPMIW
jgi:hypothetical protein